ncbi:MAG: hypothetical protein JXJ22_18845 [Bacteroidales bacterium]|nr:hypothetical protein [Bacteroidales bacterium]
MKQFLHIMHYITNNPPIQYGVQIVKPIIHSIVKIVIILNLIISSSLGIFI